MNMPGAQQDSLHPSEYGPDGKPTTPLSRLLDMATAQGRLDELATQIESTRKALPGWTAGKVPLAMVACRTGKPDVARTLVGELLDETRDDSNMLVIYWTLGVDLENDPTTRDLALTLYRRCLTNPGNDPSFVLNYQYGPSRRLVALYVRDDRREDARQFLLEASRPRDYPDYAGNEEAVARMPVLVMLGRS